jgi:hypothetical protein
MDMISILSLRWHDPDQVSGRRRWSHLHRSLSAPITWGSPVMVGGVGACADEVKDRAQVGYFITSRVIEAVRQK